MIFVLFYVWEYVRVWIHWNCSFDMHLNYPGSVSCFYPSWILRFTMGGGHLQWLMAPQPQHFFFFLLTSSLCPQPEGCHLALVPLDGHQLAGCNLRRIKWNQELRVLICNTEQNLHSLWWDSRPWQGLPTSPRTWGPCFLVLWTQIQMRLAISS